MNAKRRIFVILLLLGGTPASAVEFRLLDKLTAKGGVEISTSAAASPLIFASSTTNPGNVGIGTAAPGQRLEVMAPTGSPAVSGSAQNGIFRVQGSAGGNGLDIGVLTGSPYGTWLQAGYKSDLSINYPLLLNPNGGNVGIGTAGPGAKLHVNGNTYMTGDAYGGLSIGEAPVNYDGWDRQLTLNGTVHARVTVKTANVRMGMYAHDTWTAGTAGYIGTYTNHPVAFMISAAQKMVIDTSGNVGIGMTSAGLRLEVSGKIKANNVGVHYIRWGRNTCPAGNTLVYDGYVAGSHYTHTSGANRLCMTKSPTWDVYNDANLDHSLLYGGEYQTSTGQIGLDALHDYEIPCAVCLVEDAGAQFMHPGSQVCPAGWTLQYAGYLMGQQYQQTTGSADFLCMDRAAQSIGTNADQNGALFYSVEGECGALPCGPYVQNREITCSVCTR